MTINEAIYNILEGTGISTDDYSVPKRFVYLELRNTVNELKKLLISFLNTANTC